MTKSGDGRVADVATLVVAVLVAVAANRQRSDPTSFGESIARLLHDLPDWSKTLLGGVFALASIYVGFIIVMAMLARDRSGLVRDLLRRGRSVAR